jgi:hypothetical protein
MYQKTKHNNLYYNLLIGGIAALLFLPFLGGVHLFDWDEINFAESAREMIASGNYTDVQINFVPFWEKPPLFIWMQALSMLTFGINEFAARLPNAVCGIVSLLILFNIGRNLRDQRFGLIWALLYGGSILPFFYFKSGIIDPWFNLFIFLGIYQFYLYFERNTGRTFHAGAAALYTGLAVLTKGPVALLIVGITVAVILIRKKFRVHVKPIEILLFALILMITGGFWFVLQLLEGNYHIIADFITYQIRLFRTKDAGHGGFLLYHFVILFVGVFPASIIALPSLIRTRGFSGKNMGFYLWMFLLFWVVLILFTIVKTKIVHYSSLCYFPLTFLAAYTIYHEEELISGWKRIIRVLIPVMGTILATVFIGITFIDHFKAGIISHGWIKDPFAVANLEACGGWHGYEMIAGIILIGGIVVFCATVRKCSLFIAVRNLNIMVALFMFASMFLVVPCVERYSQNAAVEFFTSVKNEDVYLQTIGYKSYAHLFYGKIKAQKNPSSRDKEWLLKGATDKTTYFSVKITRKEKFVAENPGMVFLYEKNGFAFYKRNAVQ